MHEGEIVVMQTRYITCVLIFSISLLFSLQAIIAEEGMYTLDNIPENIAGFQLTHDDIYRPDGGSLSDAVIMIGGGTGSFVSSEGLVLTNHHVALGALQKNSTPEDNYLKDGFYAQDFSQELPAPGYRAYITLGFQDITEKVLEGISTDMDPAERSKTIDRKIALIEKENYQPGNGLEGRVASMLDGQSYFLYTYKEFKDIRLVYAPPLAIGNYGGDVDNWVWPRHMGDFSFLRVYVEPDGAPAEYSPDNVPFQPKSYLTVSTKGLKPGDFTFVMGYPGHTMRYRTSYSVAYNQECSYPFRIQLFGSLIGILQDESKGREDLQIKFSSVLQGLNNSRKYYEGILAGFKKTRLLFRKRREEKAFRDWVGSSPERRARYASILEEIEKTYRELEQFYDAEMLLRYLSFSTALKVALKAQRWSEEKTKPASERKPGFQDFQIEKAKKYFEIGYSEFHTPTDARILTFILAKMIERPRDEWPDFLDEVMRDTADMDRLRSYVDNLYANSRLVNKEEALRLFDLSADELQAIDDPMIAFAAKVNRVVDHYEQYEDAFKGKITQLRPQYYEALSEWKKGNMYPDANRTIRFTYGHIKGYFPRDAVYYRPRTFLRGALEKHTGQEPFDCPTRLFRLYNQRDFGDYADHRKKDVPVAFLATTDITGGNSGSPVMNGRGEIIGCAFDGNWEAMTSDWQYNERLTRTISVDSRYILFILDKFSGAQKLLQELTIR